MDADVLQRAWVAQAQADAERGVVACRMCRWQARLDEALTLWRNGVLVFAVCDRCTGASDVLIRRTDAGLEIRGRTRSPLVVRGGP
jgi:hypothetical protein